jgi:iron(III) transport system substrate-binding protein
MREEPMLITRLSRRLVTALPVLALASGLLCPGARAQAQGASLDAVATYAGADREPRLMEGAKREGEMTVYSALPTEDTAVLVQAFERKHGVKVKVWRASAENMLQRIIAEAKARRFEVDAVMNNLLEPLHREKLLQRVDSPHFANLIPEAVPPHREWASMFLNVFVQAYNTNLVKPDEVPKSFRDLLKPSWKGRLGIESEDWDWFAEVVRDMGEEEGLKLFRDMVATNGVSVRKGHTLLTNLVVAGEVPFALTVYGYQAEQFKKKGAPLDWLLMPPTVARATHVAVARNAPHPNAAVLFFDFIISDGQKILAERNFVATSKTTDSPFTKGPMKLIDPRVMLDDATKWQELYDKTVLKQGR